jgi:2-phosphoglycerate kinase
MPRDGSNLQERQLGLQKRSLRLIFIGGAPFSGKTLIARTLAQAHGFVHISTDDIGLAARAVTTPDTHRRLHATVIGNYLEYYANHTTEELLADANAAHNALWPVIRDVAEAHLEWAWPAVLEGWALLPDFVMPLLGPRVAAVWLCASRSILRARIRKDGFLERSEQSFQGFLERSVAFDQQLRGCVPSNLLVEVRPRAAVEKLAEKCWKLVSDAEKVRSGLLRRRFKQM